MNSDQLRKIVEQFSRKSDAGYGDITVTRIPDHKTTFVEQVGGEGRTVMMAEYRVDGVTYWAGFSMRSQTVYISLSA